MYCSQELTWISSMQEKKWMSLLQALRHDHETEKSLVSGTANHLHLKETFIFFTLSVVLDML